MSALISWAKYTNVGVIEPYVFRRTTAAKEAKACMLLKSFVFNWQREQISCLHNAIDVQLFVANSLSEPFNRMDLQLKADHSTRV